MNLVTHSSSVILKCYSGEKTCPDAHGTQTYSFHWCSGTCEVEHGPPCGATPLPPSVVNIFHCPSGSREHEQWFHLVYQSLGFLAWVQHFLQSCFIWQAEVVSPAFIGIMITSIKIAINTYSITEFTKLSFSFRNSDFSQLHRVTTSLSHRFKTLSCSAKGWHLHAQ